MAKSDKADVSARGAPIAAAAKARPAMAAVVGKAAKNPGAFALSSGAPEKGDVEAPSPPLAIEASPNVAALTATAPPISGASAAAIAAGADEVGVAPTSPAVSPILGGVPAPSVPSAAAAIDAAEKTIENLKRRASATAPRPAKTSPAPAAIETVAPQTATPAASPHPEVPATSGALEPAATAAATEPAASATSKPSAAAAPPAKAEASARPAQKPGAAQTPATTPLPDMEKLSRNAARFIEEGGKALSAYLKPRETGEQKLAANEELGEIFTTFGRVAEYYMSDAQRAFHAQSALSQQFLQLWSSTLDRLQGRETTPVAAPDPGDKRFTDPDWQANPYFDFVKQAYVLTTRWADDLVRRADDVDPHTRDKAAFYLKQVTSALSPSNFLATNPELIKATLAESGENLVRGMHMMAEDIEAGHGNLRIRQVDAAKFKLGVNMAMTPGKVIFRNELIELIQYAPSTPDVYKRPLLIVPPWINKFYVLDLNPEKSFIRYAVSQGLTVFVVSWVNPDERQADKGFEAYMREGIFAALDAIEAATGEKTVTSIGYCVGGTLLAVTLAFMAEIGDTRIKSATFFTTQVDFSDPGDLKVFVDAEQLKSLEQKMADAGYLDGAHMANAFNMLRPNDLIWSYWVNNYLKGKEPMAFDLLVWNADSTRMPLANHRFYLRHCYLQNDLAKGSMTIEGRPVSLSKVTIPVYNLAAREDHIAPARSVFNGAKLFGGPMRYVMSGSGHIAGVVNPPSKPKYQFWTGGPPQGHFADWVANAKETPGSWWPDWVRWVTEQAPEKVAPREPGAGKLKALEDAPGTYVRVKA